MNPAQVGSNDWPSVDRQRDAERGVEFLAVDPGDAVFADQAGGAGQAAADGSGWASVLAPARAAPPACPHAGEQRQREKHRPAHHPLRKLWVIG